MTVIAAAGVIERDGKVLLTRRKEGQHLAGKWEFPGGKLNPGEDPRDAVVRECREECAIDIEALEIFDVTFHAYPERDVLLLFYACRWLAHEVQHIEVADHVWCDPNQLDDYELPPADLPLVAKIKARGGVFMGGEGDP